MTDISQIKEQNNSEYIDYIYDAEAEGDDRGEDDYDIKNVFTTTGESNDCKIGVEFFSLRKPWKSYKTKTGKVFKTVKLQGQKHWIRC